MDTLLGLPASLQVLVGLLIGIAFVVGIAYVVLDRRGDRVHTADRMLPLTDPQFSDPPHPAAKGGSVIAPPCFVSPRCYDLQDVVRWLSAATLYFRWTHLPNAPGFSGVLLNNTAENGRLLALCARHTFNGSYQYPGETYTVRVSHRKPSKCVKPGMEVVDESELVIADRVRILWVGGTPGQSSGAEDLVLVELLNPVATRSSMSAHGMVYAGWSRALPEVGNAFTIGHGAGLPQSLSRSKVPPQAIEAWDGMMMGIRVDEGRLVTGDSGSPVVSNAMKGALVLGALRGPGISCSRMGHFTYGATIGHNWIGTGRGMGGRNLADFLDPNQGDPITMNMMEA